MTKAAWLAATALVASPMTAFAQTAATSAVAEASIQTAPATISPAVDAAQQGVLVFEPVFFADSQPNTALDMIERLPGFNLDTGNTDTRGFAGAAGNVLIDGDRPASKSDGLDAVLRRISAASVERIELIRGGAPGIDMQGRSVVANVVLKRTVQIERVVEANAYFYPDGYIGPVVKASYSRSEGDRQLEASFDASTDRTDGTGNGYRRRYDAAGRLIQGAELDRRDRIRFINGTAAWQDLIGGGKLRINGLVGWFSNENSIDTLVRVGTGANESSSGTYDGLNTELGANWSRPLGERSEIELTGLQRYSTADSSSGSASNGRTSAFGDDATSGESIARAVLRYRPSDRWSWETGGEGAYNFLDSATTYAENGVPVVLPSASVKVEELRGEVFGQATWRPSPTFTAEAALRVEVSEISQSGDSDRSETFVYPKPRLQLTWTPAPDNQFRLRIEREVGQLDFGDYVASADVDLNQVEGGNPELVPQTSWVIEAVYERRFWGDGALTFTLIHGAFQNRIDAIPLTGGFEAVGNIGDGTSNIQQISLTLPMDKLGLPNARLQARTTFTQTNVTDPLTGEGRPFSNRTPFGCGVSFTQDLYGGRWSYGFDHDCNVDKPVQYRIREVRYIEEEPGLRLFGQWKPKPDLTVRVDVGQANDPESRRIRYVYSGPRNTAPLVQREERGTSATPWVFVQLRKSF